MECHDEPETLRQQGRRLDEAAAVRESEKGRGWRPVHLCGSIALAHLAFNGLQLLRKLTVFFANFVILNTKS
jgi:hypothetical protein